MSTVDKWQWNNNRNKTPFQTKKNVQIYKTYYDSRSYNSISVKKTNSSFFDEDMIVVDANKLGDRFLQNFVINNLKDYFTPDGWLAVLDVFNVKVSLSTCQVCKKLFLNYVTNALLVCNGFITFVPI